jgi:hypothetical protein
MWMQAASVGPLSQVNSFDRAITFPYCLAHVLVTYQTIHPCGTCLSFLVTLITYAGTLPCGSLGNIISMNTTHICNKKIKKNQALSVLSSLF